MAQFDFYIVAFFSLLLLPLRLSDVAKRGSEREKSSSLESFRFREGEIHTHSTAERERQHGASQAWLVLPGFPVMTFG